MLHTSNAGNSYGGVTLRSSSGFAERSWGALAGDVQASGSKKTLFLGTLFGGWYLFNIYFNL